MAQATNCTVCIHGGIPLCCEYYKDGIPRDIFLEEKKCEHFELRISERDDTIPYVETNEKCPWRILK